MNLNAPAYTNDRGNVTGRSIWLKSDGITATASLVKFSNMFKSKQLHSISTRAFIVNTLPKYVTVSLLWAERERTHSVNHMWYVASNTFFFQLGIP